jgi:ATP-dependent Clp protease ATP-binding subunit ClpA
MNLQPPLTGRISAFIPFLPFSPAETYVGAHKYLLELMGEVRRPVNTSFGEEEQLLGDINLKVRQDASVCSILSQGYDPELGIRSLKKVVREKVATQLDSVYMATQGTISEGQGMLDYEVYAYNNRIKIKAV